MQYLGGQGAGPPAGPNWVQLTQAMIDGGTKRTGTEDTLKSAVESAGRTTVTSNAISTTRDGSRETSGQEIPILDILPDLDFDEHDILCWLDTPASSGAAMALALAIGNAPGSSFDGSGVLVTSSRAHPQTITSTVAAATATSHSALARFICSGADAAGTVAAVVSKIEAAGQAFQGGTSDAVDLSDPAAVFVYLQAASYSSAQAEDSTASAGIYFAAVDKVASPI